ncbi:hypothetical protein Mapa_005551 [Marchantia paleacea]|nr:hypothetical protein Mapa_005551 [Marchantia paleacea]
MASSVASSLGCSCGVLGSSKALRGAQLPQNVNRRAAVTKRGGGLLVRAVSLPFVEDGNLGFAVASGGAIAALAIALADP